MNKVQLNVLGLSNSHSQTGAYVLILEESDGNRRIPIIIGPYEAQSIALKMENLNTPRPLTHDLFVSFADSCNVVMNEILIYKLEEGVFYSSLIFTKGQSKISIDSRTSDAVALALRFNIPIFATEEIMEQGGITIEQTIEKQEPVTKEEKQKAPYSGKTIEELTKMLDLAISKENYETASKIKKEIEKRKK